MGWFVAFVLAAWIIAAIGFAFNGRPRLGAMLGLAWFVVMAVLVIIALIVGFFDSLTNFPT
jgi:hypothetical protein